MQGTSIRLASGQVIRSNPNFVYIVDGFGSCPAEEILVGDFIRFGKRNEQVVSSFTWRVRGGDKKC